MLFEKIMAKNVDAAKAKVLILVLLEYALWVQQEIDVRDSLIKS